MYNLNQHQYTKMNTVLYYNLKLLSRNKIIYIISFLVYCLILYVQLRKQSNLFTSYISDKSGFTSFIPYMNVFLFSVFLAFILTTIGSMSLYKNRKIDTLEAIYYRPESNMEYVWGVSLATICIFSGLSIISLILAAGIQLYASTASFQIGIYLFYFLTLILPSIVFLTGLSILISSIVRNQSLCQILLWLYVFVTLFYIQDFQHGLFNMLGITLPNVFSDFTGHPDITTYLLQRGCYLFLGLGFILLTVIFFNRIPNRPTKTRNIILATLLIVTGVSLGASFFTMNQHSLSLRRTYRDAYNKYESELKATLLSQNIKYTQNEKQITVESELFVQNQNAHSIENIILYLNPKLEIISLTSNNTEIPFTREHQVIALGRQLPSGDSLQLRITYAGGIDENVCYLDFPEQITTNTSNNAYLACRYGKHYAFLEKDFTLLTPEVLWYPTTVPPVNPSFPYNRLQNFSNYTLQVATQNKRTVISQGEKTPRNKDVIFQNSYPLPGISLCIGDYETHSFKLDSVLYEVNILQGHTYLLDNIKNNNNIAPEEFIAESREAAERKLSKKYPYPKLSLTETPSSFASYYRNERSSSEFVQPELIFMPERSIRVQVSPQREINSEISSKLKNLLAEETYYQSFTWENIFNTYLSNFNLKNIRQSSKNKHSINSLFYNKQLYIHSSEYPFMDVLLNLILLDNNATSSDGRISFRGTEANAINYLKTHSLQDALSDKFIKNNLLECILVLKSRELLNRLNVQGVHIDSLVNFIFSFQDTYRFQQVDFSLFDQEFENKFGVNWLSILSTWLTQNQIPRYLVDVSHLQLIPNRTGLMARAVFNIFNDSDTDGFIHFNVNSEISRNGGKYNYELEKHKRHLNVNYYAHEIKAHTGKQIALVVENVRNYTLHTNISHNLPFSYFPQQTREWISDTSRYIKAITKDYFTPDSNETIVDNEDLGFKINQSSHLRITNLFKNSTEDTEKEYESFKGFVLATTQWKQDISQDSYGLFVRSYLFKKAGRGKSSLEWTTQLDKEGEYEIMVFMPKEVLSKREKGQQQKYIIHQGKEEKIIYLDDPTWKYGWISLGNFYFPQGKCKIILCDEGAKEQVIIGDAVKWVYKNSRE